MDAARSTARAVAPEDTCEQAAEAGGVWDSCPPKAQNSYSSGAFHSHRVDKYPKGVDTRTRIKRSPNSFAGSEESSAGETHVQVVVAVALHAAPPGHLIYICRLISGDRDRRRRGVNFEAITTPTTGGTVLRPKTAKEKRVQTTRAKRI